MYLPIYYDQVLLLCNLLLT